MSADCPPHGAPVHPNEDMSQHASPGSSSLAAAALAVSLCLLGGCGGGAEKGQLLLLITVDTLRADRLGVYGSDRGLTPHLDQLAETCLLFDKAYAPASFTVPSISSLHTGRYPEQNAIYSNESILPRESTTLAEYLRLEGFLSGAVVSNYVLRAGTDLNRGFDWYDDQLGQRETTRNLPERTADPRPRRVGPVADVDRLAPDALAAQAAVTLAPAHPGPPRAATQASRSDRRQRGLVGPTMIGEGKSPAATRRWTVRAVTRR